MKTRIKSADRASYVTREISITNPTIAPIRNTLYVDPNSLASPETGTILAPYLSLQDAIDAIAPGTQWTIIIPPGIPCVGDITIPAIAATLIEIAAEGLCEGGEITGEITWNAADGSFFGLTNIFVTGDIAGVATGADSTFIVQNSTIDQTTTFSGSPVHCYYNGSFPLGVNSGFAFSYIGELVTLGNVFAQNIEFNGDVTCSNMFAANCMFDSALWTFSGVLARFSDCEVAGSLATVTFSGAPGVLSLDPSTNYY